MNYALKIMALFRSKRVANGVSGAGNSVKNKTLFIKMLTVDAGTLVSQSQSAEIKTEINKVYEAVRYSNPMSHDALADVESRITIKFSMLQDAVAQNDAGAVKPLANELLALIKDRNSKCNLLK